MKRIVLLVFVTIIFWGCDKIDEKDLTVIEGLKLGINKNDMDLYCFELSIWRFKNEKDHALLLRRYVYKPAG